MPTQHSYRCPYCALSGSDALAEERFTCPRCTGLMFVREESGRRVVVPREAVDVYDAGQQRRIDRVGRLRRGRSERDIADAAVGAIADAKASGASVDFWPTFGACGACKRLSGRYAPEAAPILPVPDCTGDGSIPGCRCALAVAGRSLWDRREAVIIAALGESEGSLRTFELAMRTRLPQPVIEAGVTSLLRDGYVATEGGTARSDSSPTRLAPRGLREIGDWPAERAYAGLVALVEYRLATSTDERDMWYELLSSVRRCGRLVINDVMAVVLRTEPSGSSSR